MQETLDSLPPGLSTIHSLGNDAGWAAADLLRRSNLLSRPESLDHLLAESSVFHSLQCGITLTLATPGVPLLYVNPAFEAMTGYSKAEVQGWNCRFLQGLDTAQDAAKELGAAIRERRATTVVIRNFRKDGSSFWNELYLSPITGLTGNVTHFVGVQNDVTARVETEAAIRQTEKLAVMGRLAASIAHEINNPLESVMNLIYLAARADDLDSSREYLATADTELQRIKLITTQSLRFCKQSTQPATVQARDLVSPVLDVYHSQMVSRNVTIEWRDRTTRPVLCMESEIRQVISNLLGNAIDAMTPGGGRLVVRARNAFDAARGLPTTVITVADTGTGMDAATRKRLFQAFFTTKGAGQIGGTGIGLWISSEIVARHQGRLLVRTSQRPSRSGTVFQLVLPTAFGTVALKAQAS